MSGLCRSVLAREFRGVAQVPDGCPGADDGDEDEQGEEQAEKGFHRVAGECSVFAGGGKGRFRNGGQEGIASHEPRTRAD